MLRSQRQGTKASLKHLYASLEGIFVACMVTLGALSQSITYLVLMCGKDLNQEHTTTKTKTPHVNRWSCS